jgi:hypothetical protein
MILRTMTILAFAGLALGRGAAPAAPFAAPLACTGLGLLFVMNRMVDRQSEEWPRWVLLMGLGGVVGNFIFSLTDHAQNGFYHRTEWIPVVSSALAVGFLVTIFLTPVTRRFLALCAIILAMVCSDSPCTRAPICTGHHATHLTTSCLEHLSSLPCCSPIWRYCAVSASGCCATIFPAARARCRPRPPAEPSTSAQPAG